MRTTLTLSQCFVFCFFSFGPKNKTTKKRRKTDYTQGLCLLKDGNERRVAAVRRLVFMGGFDQRAQLTRELQDEETSVVLWANQPDADEWRGVATKWMFFFHFCVCFLLFPQLSPLISFFVTAHGSNKRPLRSGCVVCFCFPQIMCLSNKIVLVFFAVSGKRQIISSAATSMQRAKCNVMPEKQLSKTIVCNLSSFSLFSQHFQFLTRFSFVLVVC